MRRRDVSRATATGLVVAGAVECGARSALLVVEAETGTDVAQADGFETETETGAVREDAFEVEANAERKDVVDARVIDASAENDVARGALPACELGKVMADVSLGRSCTSPGEPRCSKAAIASHMSTAA